MVPKLARNCKMEETVRISFFEKSETNSYVIGSIKFINRGVLCGSWLCGYLVVRYTVQIDRGVVERRRRVVVQETILPHGPGLGIGQFRDRSVQEGDRGTGLVVIGHPLYRRLYPVSPSVP